MKLLDVVEMVGRGGERGRGRCVVCFNRWSPVSPQSRGPEKTICAGWGRRCGVRELNGNSRQSVHIMIGRDYQCGDVSTTTISRYASFQDELSRRHASKEQKTNANVAMKLIPR